MKTKRELIEQYRRDCEDRIVELGAEKSIFEEKCHFELARDCQDSINYFRVAIENIDAVLKGDKPTVKIEPFDDWLDRKILERKTGKPPSTDGRTLFIEVTDQGLGNIIEDIRKGELCDQHGSD